MEDLGYRTVDYKNKTHFRARSQGRNGMMITTGVYINAFRTISCVDITPINSKDMLGNCFIQVPLEDVDAVIEALKSCKEYIEKKEEE